MIDEQPYVRFVIPSIAAGEAQQVSFSVTVNEEATEDDVIRNTAQVYEPTAEEIGEDGTFRKKSGTATSLRIPTPSPIRWTTGSSLTMKSMWYPRHWRLKKRQIKTSIR